MSNYGRRAKIMRTLPAVVFALALSFQAHAENPDPVGKVVILGYAIPVPVRVDQPMEWDAVRGHVPANLYRAPGTPMTARDIYNELDRLMRVSMKDYEAALDALAMERQDDYPGQTPEEIRYILADYFVTGEGDDISPEVQRLTNEFAALQFLHEAFETELEAQGYDPLKHAPGPVPENK